MRRLQRAFSLVELMAVLAIASILLSVGVPNLRTLMVNQQIRSATDELFGAIDLTRSSAIARGRRVQLVPADEAGVDWRRGWIVFVDRDGNGRPSAGDEIIRVHGPLPQGITLDTAFSGNHQPYYIAYNGAGRSCSLSSSQAAHYGTLSLFHGERIRRIKISMLGRARVCDPAREPSTCTGAAEGG